MRLISVQYQLIVFETILKYNIELNLILEFSSLRSLEETIFVSSAKRMVLETLFMMHGKSLTFRHHASYI